eukprot:CAMPEP_0194526896 /NCGR_PEP_ID=MMETSP0253-20130528/62829_1 /TAXON_ID=2966 /ORGANISM="Noctiluca scintillans" /LENGTH=97 /DNA_ID=CAMNT_0039371759 /DNA_START=45 /DNA_END=338 /DNA_ORIENTATION=-
MSFAVTSEDSRTSSAAILEAADEALESVDGVQFVAKATQEQDPEISGDTMTTGDHILDDEFPASKLGDAVQFKAKATLENDADSIPDDMTTTLSSVP